MKKFLTTAAIAAVAIAGCRNGGNDGGGKTTDLTMDTRSVVFGSDGDSGMVEFVSPDDWTASVINSRADGWCSVNPQSGPAGEARIEITAAANETPDDRSATVVVQSGGIRKPVTVTQKQKDALTLTSSKFEVDFGGGSITIGVKANVDYEYAVDEDASGWIIPLASRGFERSTVSFGIAENESTEKREAAIVFRSGAITETVTVYQAGSRPSITLTQDEFTVSDRGGELHVEVSSNVDAAAELPAGAGWISENLSRAMSTSSFRFTVEPNDSYVTRRAEIRFVDRITGASAAAKVTQLQKDASIPAEEYESSDFSADGHVEVMQQATEGRGIDLVFVGDGYSDRLVAYGTYDETMRLAAEKFFTEEPYKTFRNRFNVYAVTAVSKHELFDEGYETAFSSYFGEGTLVGGDDARVFAYAEKAVSEERIDEALIVVMLNSTRYAGTCYMYPPSADAGDYGCGVSVAYFPAGERDSSLEQLLHHEAGGHGFAKLDDEYSYRSMGAIPPSEVLGRKYYEAYGWWKNTDTTDDPAAVKWSVFLSDTRYAGEEIGVYQGGSTYWSGVWRPTQNSIMRYNTGGFNAPSREAIYYRIHKLAFGPEWVYDFEKFAEYDAVNRGVDSGTRGADRTDIPAGFRPTHPPVVRKVPWREAGNAAPLHR